MVRILLIAAGLLTAPFVKAQQVKLLNSTNQSWSGGIAGHMGNNYTFSVEFSHCKKEPKPDTIWLGHEPIPINKENTKMTHSGSTYRFDIHAGTSRDDYANHQPQGNEKPHRPLPPVTYKGVALLSYIYKSRQRYYPISHIMVNYPPVNYP